MARSPALFWLAAFAFLLGALYLLSGILLPFVAGCAIAYFLDPAVDRLELWRVPRGLATAVVLGLFLLALVLLILLVLPLLELQAAEIARRAPGSVDYLRQQLQALIEAAQQKLSPDDVAKLKELAGGWAASAAGWMAQLLERVLTSGLALANLLSLIVVTPVVAFFLLRDWDLLVARIDLWLPRRHAETIREQARLVDATLAGFVHGQFLVGLVLAVYYAAALTLVGLNFAVILAIIIGILCFIPYVGVLTGLGLGLGLGLAQFGASPALLAIVCIFALGYATESNFLSPRLVGRRVNLHPVWIIFAIFAFGSLFGFLGILVALPMAAVIGVLVRFALGRYLASPLYDPAGGRPDGKA
jgi:predicted PurR-regulated permease PerM